MEAKRCSQRWRKHLPQSTLSRRCSSPMRKDGERGKTERERGTNKSVSLAPTSRYLTDRQYVMRKPLFSAEQTSILKKTQEEKLSGLRSRDQTEMSFSSRPGEDPPPQSPSPSHRDVSPPSAWREDLGSPWGIWELRGRRSREEPTSGSAQRSLFSSILEVQRLDPPQRPRLTSTVLNPTYTPRSWGWRPGQMGGGGRGESRLCFTGGRPKGGTMSPYQENYWACAIPKTGPPSPDRLSADWDPNREYQALLDYTYPLRPPQVSSEWHSSELRGGSLQQTDLQDSGIELDHLCSSTSLSGLDLSVSGTGQIRERTPPGAGNVSPDLPGWTGSAGGLPPLTDPVGLSSTSLEGSPEGGGLDQYRSGDDLHHQHLAPPPSFCVPPLPRPLCGGVDEEFWPLPEQLEELQLLSRQVREVTARLSRPVSASWESLEPGTTSILSSVTLPEKQEAKGEDGGRDGRSPAQTAGHRDSGAGRRTCGAQVEPDEEGLSRSSLREVEALMEQLRGLSLPQSQRSSQEDREKSDSLMQQIQVFCSHLEQLIQQLYALSEKMELLAPPTADINSVKSCLAEYQSLQRAMSRHQPLTSCVLHTGQLLLSCINATSPLLRDALQLIQNQSGALQTCTERLFSSILSATDSLTQPSLPSPVQQSREEDQDLLSVEVRGSSS